MFGQLQVLNGDFPPFLQIPVKQHFVQVSVLWQAGPPWGSQGGWLGVGSTLGVFQTKGEWGVWALAGRRGMNADPNTHMAAGREGASANGDPLPTSPLSQRVLCSRSDRQRGLRLSYGI